jgi:serine/threonine-protein kinase
VLWERLPGRRLFKGETDYDTVMNVRDAAIPPVTSINPNIPQEMDTILARALERDLDSRYQDAAEFGGELMKMLFARQMLVTSYDIAKLVKSVQQAEPRDEVSREVDIIDRLIEDELARITSVEDGENPFSDGAKPILTSELSGMLGGPETGGSLEDPRQWGADLLTETGEFQLPEVEDGAWRESQVYELGDPSSDAPQKPVDLEQVASEPDRARQTTSPAIDTGEKPEEKKSHAGLWVAITALAAIGAAAAVYYFVFMNG